MTKEAILLHFETIFACEPRLILQAIYSYFSNAYHNLITGFVLPKQRCGNLKVLSWLGTGGIAMADGLNMHGLLQILKYISRKAVFKNFIRKRMVGMLFCFM